MYNLSVVVLSTSLSPGPSDTGFLNLSYSFSGTWIPLKPEQWSNIRALRAWEKDLLPEAYLNELWRKVILDV